MAPTIALNNLGKKFNREWIFRGLDIQIQSGRKLLIRGGNGSGKSTLLQVISGFITPNEGEVVFSTAQGKIEQQDHKNYISFASPYLQLVEDFTLVEMIEHSRIFKPLIKDLSTEEILVHIGLKMAKDKFIRQFSSGMKQRLKLGLAILADTPVLLLDEPVSNLDKEAIAWYREMIGQHTTDRTVIVCSNAIADEHFFCDTELNVGDHKPAAK